MTFKAANAFAEIAEGYCTWCEGLSLGPEPEVLAATWLAKLYAAALALPGVVPEDGEHTFAVDPDRMARAKSNLAAFNGSYYRVFFDPHPHLTDEAGLGDVGDDLFDTYKDLALGLVVLANGHPNDAIWHWQFHHRFHWGRHAVGALFALHCFHISKLGEKPNTRLAPQASR